MLTDPSARTARHAPDRAAGEPASRDRFRHVFRAEPTAVRDALRRAVARFARRLTREDAWTLELTLAEALNNVVEHGYCHRSPGLIDLQLCLAAEVLTCRIEDFGSEMPGLALPAADLPPVEVDVADLAEGGWGWALIREFTADLSYARLAGRNILTFRVPLCGRGISGT